MGLPLFFSCTRQGPERTPVQIPVRSIEGGPEIRILIAERVPTLTLSVAGPCRLLSTGTGALLDRRVELPPVRVRAWEKGFWIGRTPVPGSDLILAPEDSAEGVLRVENRFYRGKLRLLRHGDGTFSAVNLLPIESYLAGVVGAELPLKEASPAAVEAQAVAARSYALYQAGQRRGLEYDLLGDTRDQMYTGLSAERADPDHGRLIWEAIRSTEKEVLLHQGSLFPAYYHSTCGGMTSSASRIGGPAPPPLSGGVRCDYCRISKAYRWPVRMFPEEEVRRRLEEAGMPVGELREIEPVRPDAGGRFEGVEIRHARGMLALPVERFRQILGGRALLSARFESEVRRGMVYFQGWGWGHGVGLCQYGTIGMAREGFTARQILAHYYPGAQVGPGY
jgi:stage II sporulation protein D